MFISFHYKHAHIHRDAGITFLSQIEMLIFKALKKGLLWPSLAIVMLCKGAEN